jgi:glycerol-3-phosphate dehydrogenase
MLPIPWWAIMLLDLLVIGGGVNGCGVARDAVGRGLSVALVEMNDLASGTSSASTKLIHGGLRYLEYGAFRLVREALTEREVLLRLAPHIIWPLRFVIPYQKGLRPAWELRLGLFLYDHLGGRKILPGSRSLDLARDPAGEPLKSDEPRGFEYSDCWVDDARLVALNAMDAAARGARIETRAKVVAAERREGRWLVTVEKGAGRDIIEARAVVNAAGPWASEVLDGVFGAHPAAHVRMVQGSHIVVPKLFDHDRCYLFQNADKRIVFAIPYEHDFTLIGTTDRDWRDHPDHVHASADEIAYLCSAANDYFKKSIAPSDVVWSYSGVRPLYDDGAKAAQAATRDYVLLLDRGTGDEAPLVTVFGGKITTYRRLAEHVMQKLATVLPEAGGKGWTHEGSLPGGDFPVDGFDALVASLLSTHAWLAPAHARRLCRAYGTRAFAMLDGATSINALGGHFGADLYEIEARYLVEHEFARTADDILWRRSKLGLRLSADEIAAFDAWMTAAVTP